MSRVRIGGEIDESVVTFILSGEFLDPDAVTAALGLVPTKSFKKGDPTPSTHRNPNLRRKQGMWQLESMLPRQAPLDRHIEHLLDRLDTHASEIGEFLKLGYGCRFSCGCFLNRWNRGTELSPRTLGRIGALGASLGLDIYCDDGVVDVVDDEEKRQ